MATLKVNGSTGEEVAKEVFWLAWQACGFPMGMGVFQDNPTATKEDVWKNITDMGDYPVPTSIKGEAYADYVFGRMLKLRITYGDDFITISDTPPARAYQSWCPTYPRFLDLLNAAAKILKCSLE